MKNKKNKNKSGNRRSRSSQPPKTEAPEENSKTEMVSELPPPTDVTEINEEVSENTDLPLVTSEKVDVSSQEPVVLVDDEKQKENELEESKTEQVEEDIQEIEQKAEVDVENLEGKEEEEHVDELEVAEEGAEEGNDSVDGGDISQKRTQSDDEQSVAFSEPEVWTNYDYDRKDEEYDVDQITFWKSYKKKYSAVLRFIDPEFRYIAEIGPAETFDSEGVDKMIAKMEELGIQNAWPFAANFTATTKELRQFLPEVLDKIKFCLRLACAERGYEFKSGNSNFAPISSVWGEEIDPILELKTLKAIVDKMKEHLMRDEAEGQEARFWAETDNIFQFVMPALEIFDSKTLSENGISDCMSSIHGRKDLGFEISEEEVDEMLERSFNESGFGEFPPTALFAPEVFTTVNQLKMIFNQIEQMSKVVDVRVKLSAIQMITRIFQQISDDDATTVLEEFKDHNPVKIEKMFGIDPLKFEVNRDSKRTQYLKIFFTILGENPKEEFEFSTERLTAAFKCLYLVFNPFEVNMIIFKIIGTRIRENYILDKDRKKLIDVLLKLPEFLIKRLEIGPKFMNGDVSDDNRVSMYFQLKTVLGNGNKDQIEKFGNFVASNSDRTAFLVSAEKAFRMVMKCVETGTCRTMAIEVLKSLAYRCSSILPNEFYEDLIIFALSKYSFPDEKPVESKYQFIDIVFNVINQHKDALEEVLKGPSIKEKWTNMGHHWSSVLYLTHKFPVLKDASPAPLYPWLSADKWNGEEQDKAELKNYFYLAKVPTAWPNCTDLKIVEDLVSEHVPHDVSRSDLYTEMRQYVSEFTIKEEWKKKLLNSFDKKIGFLTSHITKEPHQEETSETSEPPELKQDLLQNVVETSEAVVEKVEDDEEAENVGPESIESEKEEKTIEEDVTDAVLVKTKELNDKENKEDLIPDDTTSEIPDRKSESVEKNEQENKTEDTGTETEQKKEESDVSLKPLRNVSNPFLKRYTDKEWENMPEECREEVMRQRKFYGFSNEV